LTRGFLDAGEVQRQFLSPACQLLGKAAATGIALNASRNGKLQQQKRHALAIRMQAREDHYLRFARDPRVPLTITKLREPSG
jgi:hypothetical protein